ncbi:conserved hypothetical protein [Candidatus Terasakiella magnetica]|uniref:Uncharacterized protein n=1 Tax=Candidatus Terasakiella magnetica TaxID=1867952 RepID=A0A1C3RDQ1_9PROT|nr:hypothetical protein [Candidatus Terasakiella magnetica]SCA55399.1 conserved hypothetical protein [Candidatus Terasakiella magnetica]
MSLTKIGLCSRALLKIGANTISSFDDGSAESEVAQNLYPGVRDSLLSSYPWSFATAQIRLARLTATPIADFSYAYQLPADFLRALSVGTGDQGRGVTYRIQEKRLHTDMDDVVLTYIFRPEPTEFPPYFTQGLITHLAAEFCLPLTESASRGEAFMRIGEKELQKARNIDAQQQTPQTISLDGLVGVRY